MEIAPLDRSHTSFCSRSIVSGPILHRFRHKALLPVQCYAWKEYKFTCVCLSVCVSVKLSFNSPTGQTPQQIFTVDSLKDAYLRKDVPFGGLDDEDHSHLGVQSRPKPPFWGPE